MVVNWCFQGGPWDELQRELTEDPRVLEAYETTGQGAEGSTFQITAPYGSSAEDSPKYPYRISKREVLGQLIEITADFLGKEDWRIVFERAGMVFGYWTGHDISTHSDKAKIFASKAEAAEHLEANRQRMVERQNEFDGRGWDRNIRRV